MVDLSNGLLVLAVSFAFVGVVLMMAMGAALSAQGHKVNWLLVRLFILGYIARYRRVTADEFGRPGPLFYPFVIVMNSALLFGVGGLLLRAL